MTGRLGLEAVAKPWPLDQQRQTQQGQTGASVTNAFPMQRRPPWLLIGALAALILLPGPTLRLLFGLAKGLSLLLLVPPLLAGLAGLAGWLWWRRLQARIRQCPSCGIPTMNTTTCPTCGYSFAGAAPESGNKNAPIDVQAETLED
ncbi:MAG: hypothetical protein F4Z75_02625 [Synechococcus sp. SB0668_bin_15]|nr:hypothetical protein [Synechococcus sp. SB0668_bin_15]MYC50227.1 hypothetical protein [Synechococcus sp. SB0662_bin_14]